MAIISSVMPKKVFLSSVPGPGIGYLLVSYSPFEELTFPSSYDEYYRLIRNRHESVGARNLYPWRKDLAAALRYGITENLTFKQG